MKNEILKYLGFLISICSILFVFIFTDFYKNVSSLLHAKLYFLLIAIGLQFISYLAWALRIKLLVKLFGKKISLKDAYIATLITVFYSAITPSSSGGEPMRVKVIQDSIHSYGISSAVVISERAIDFIVLSLSVPILALLGFLTGDLRIIAGIASIGILTGIIIIFYLLIEKVEFINKIAYRLLSKFIKKQNLQDIIKRELHNLRESLLHLMQVSKVYIVILFILTTLSWGLAFLSFPISVMSLGEYIPITFAITLQVVLVLASTVFFTPGGSGLIELSSAYVLSKYITKSAIGASIFVWRLSTYYIPMFVGSLVNMWYFKK